MDIVDKDLVAAREEELQRFLEKHSAARATKEQLKKVFEAGWDEGLTEEDQVRVIDFIEDPYCLYPLEHPTLLESALEMAKSMVVAGRQVWNEDIQDKMEEPKEMEEHNAARQQQADFHCHLRQDAMMELVTPLIREGGCDTVFVMPNLQPPVTRVSQAISYHEQLSRLAPHVKFLMSLYLHPSVNAEVIAEAARSRIVYGVTTNSQDGVLDIEQYYPVFEAMQTHDLVLNLHGEAPGVEVLDAEAAFIPQLQNIHATFPRLRIVLEHVRGTITAHHLWVTTEDAEHDVYSFCKPIAKTLEDRIALLKAVVDGSSKFFFGSDSAPHPLKSKQQAGGAAGCFTQPFCTSLVLNALEHGIRQGWITKEEVTREAVEGFLSTYGRTFYKISDSEEVGLQRLRIQLSRLGETVPRSIKSANGELEVVPFRSGQEIMSLAWMS
ncbi:MAG: hypothetical protein Q9208_005984 [Pyrenodesmia sp. 3 TL-2023]